MIGVWSMGFSGSVLFRSRITNLFNSFMHFPTCHTIENFIVNETEPVVIIGILVDAKYRIEMKKFAKQIY